MRSRQWLKMITLCPPSPFKRVNVSVIAQDSDFLCVYNSVITLKNYSLLIGPQLEMNIEYYNYVPTPRMIIRLKFLLLDLHIEPLSFIQNKHLKPDYP